ncbi:MAG: DNA (cytosine-5-)-methyltransferase [Campylobacterales bacterium]
MSYRANPLLFGVKNSYYKEGRKKPTLKFVDLFCGIGGFHKAIIYATNNLNIDVECVFASDIDESARKTYILNYGIEPAGDITQIKENSIPSHDILFAGFPCQAFSVAGYRKGFEDTRGTLFFDVARIAKYHSPSIIFLENVKGLVGHDKGRTFKKIVEVLEKELGYIVKHKVLNTSVHTSIPQTRERIYIVASKKELSDSIFPKETSSVKEISQLLDSNKQEEKYYYNTHKYYDILKQDITKRETVYQWRRHYVRENKSNQCPTLTANMGTGGHNVPLIKDSYGIRKLTPKECLRFQGFDEEFSFPDIALSQKYKQIGNSVTVPLASELLSNIIKELENEILP